ncbi:sensor histidine kinase [Rhizomonospora bruguierae]|uniref:sensor histidine kinase n=1 Tax=Rhizomonospora bruguierae TaxID=1581705 RepID=UPI001BCDC6E0|nr:HAMP domain-containing sensor histidine kinase [Micromonospora sp. NBRC 107566]
MATLSGIPLRVKLVAAVLALVAAALLVIGVTSAFALRYYLTHRIDQQLAATSTQVTQNALLMFQDPDTQITMLLPSDYSVGLVGPAARNLSQNPRHSPTYAADDLPPLPADVPEAQRNLNRPITVLSVSGRDRWRALVTSFPDGNYLVVAQSLADVDMAMRQLAWIDVLVGGVVLILLASVGAGIVRTSLRPLVQIEQTAAAIAAGDLTRRVPDPEPGTDRPATELGRLSRALNAMLTQIEAAFTARSASEMAARSAESAARNAAMAAQASETRARRSEERMRQFVADASHELRTPLTTIRGFAELYRQGAAREPEEVARLLRRIEDEAARMGLLVEDLLLLARLDLQRPLQATPVELPVLANEAVQAARAVAPDRPIELDLEAAGPLVVLGDDARLRQVIGNLMTNALTHTPPDVPVTLKVRADPAGFAVIEVIDRGPGLTPEQMDRVFERFYRADAARSRRGATTPGTGLGLAIVAALVAAHRGTVEVDSEPGRGATFRVRLPLARDVEPAA